MQIGDKVVSLLSGDIGFYVATPDKYKTVTQDNHAWVLWITGEDAGRCLWTCMEYLFVEGVIY